MVYLDGNWKAGWAIDLHTVSSQINTNGSFDTLRTKTGELVYRLKYKQDYNAIYELSNIAALYLKTLPILFSIDAILPVPPSKQRKLQPVPAIANEVGKLLNKKVDNSYIKKHLSTSEMKEIKNPYERANMLEGVFGVEDGRYQGKNILLFDDLFRSGSTLKELTKVLYSNGKVQNVYVVTMTKTRVNR